MSTNSSSLLSTITALSALRNNLSNLHELFTYMEDYNSLKDEGMSSDEDTPISENITNACMNVFNSININIRGNKITTNEETARKMKIASSVCLRLLNDNFFHQEEYTDLNIRQIFIAIICSQYQSGNITLSEANNGIIDVSSRSESNPVEVPYFLSKDYGSLWRASELIFDSTFHELGGEFLGDEHFYTNLTQITSDLELLTNLLMGSESFKYLSTYVENDKKEAFASSVKEKKGKKGRKERHLTNNQKAKIYQDLCHRFKFDPTDFNKLTKYCNKIEKIITDTLKEIHQTKNSPQHIAKQLDCLFKAKENTTTILMEVIEKLKKIHGGIASKDRKNAIIEAIGKVAGKKYRTAAKDTFRHLNIVEKLVSSIEVIMDLAGTLSTKMNEAYNEATLFDLSEWDEPKEIKLSSSPTRRHSGEKTEQRHTYIKKDKTEVKQKKRRSKSPEASNKKETSNEEVSIQRYGQEVMLERSRCAYKRLKRGIEKSHPQAFQDPRVLASLKQMKHSLMHAMTGFEEVMQNDFKTLPQSVTALVFDLHASMEQVITVKYLAMLRGMPAKHHLTQNARLIGIIGDLSPETRKTLRNNNEGTLYMRYPQASENKLTDALPEALKLRTDAYLLDEDDIGSYLERVETFFADSLQAFDEIVSIVSGEKVEYPRFDRASLVEMSQVKIEESTHQQLSDLADKLENLKKNADTRAQIERFADLLFHVESLQSCIKREGLTEAAKAKQMRDTAVHFQSAIEIALIVISSIKGDETIISHDLSDYFELLGEDAALKKELIKFSLGGALRYPKFKTEKDKISADWVEQIAQARKYANNIEETAEGKFEIVKRDKKVLPANEEVLEEMIDSGLEILGKLIALL